MKKIGIGRAPGIDLAATYHAHNSKFVQPKLPPKSPPPKPAKAKKSKPSKSKPAQSEFSKNYSAISPKQDKPDKSTLPQSAFGGFKQPSISPTHS